MLAWTFFGQTKWATELPAVDKRFAEAKPAKTIAEKPKPLREAVKNTVKNVLWNTNDVSPTMIAPITYVFKI